MKSVLMSIAPKWCELIANGEKTIDVRKTKPKIETPFKCYIYCTKEKYKNKYLHTSNKKNRLLFWHNKGDCEIVCQPENTSYIAHSCFGKVIGEFVCDEISKFTAEFTDGKTYEDIRYHYFDEFEEGLTSDDRVYVAGVSAKMGVVDAAVNYYKVDTEYDQDIYEIAAGWEFMDDLTLKGAWYNGDVSDSNGDDNGWMVGLNYAGAKASKVGSWGAYVNYMDRPWNTVIYPTLASYTSVPETLATDVDGDGYKGIEAGANLTLAKNIVAGVKYYNLDSREGDANTETIWSEVIFTF